MSNHIYLDEADCGLGTYGGVPEDRYAGEVFIGGTKKRPLEIIFNEGDEESSADWDVYDITLFHPDGREEQVDWNTLHDRMTKDELTKLYERIDEMVCDYFEARVENSYD
jgi:hypothetical protein